MFVTARSRRRSLDTERAEPTFDFSFQRRTAQRTTRENSVSFLSEIHVHSRFVCVLSCLFARHSTQRKTAEKLSLFCGLELERAKGFEPSK